MDYFDSDDSACSFDHLKVKSLTFVNILLDHTKWGMGDKHGLGAMRRAFRTDAEPILRDHRISRTRRVERNRFGRHGGNSQARLAEMIFDLDGIHDLHRVIS